LARHWWVRHRAQKAGHRRFSVLVRQEFERDLIRERVKSGLAAAKANGAVLGRKKGFRPSDKKAKRVLKLHEEGLSYRLIGRNLGLSKNTVMDIVKRADAAQ
jgi:putative DNA-invertase from lambdoid prophage Rac